MLPVTRCSGDFLIGKVVKSCCYLSRPGLQTTHSSSLLMSVIKAYSQTALPQWIHATTPPPAAQCSDDTWSITYVSGNLFSCPKDESLAHCISQDFRMGAGIAVRFKKEFGGVAELKGQQKQMGQCAVLKDGRRYVYYLITKARYYQKPTYDSLKRSLEDMKSHCVVNAVSKVSMPRIGCGLDKLAWRRVAEILKEVFEPSNISITVYSLPEKTETAVMKENSRHKYK